MRGVTKSLSATKVAEPKAANVKIEKLDPPGCVINKTPTNPTKTAAQRCQLTISILRTAHRTVMMIGVACMMDVRSLIGRCEMAVT